MRDETVGRCWPKAHRRVIEARQREIREWFRAGQRASVEWAAGKGPSTEQIPAPSGLTMTWHWTLSVGTLWREWRFGGMEVSIDSLDD